MQSPVAATTSNITNNALGQFKKCDIDVYIKSIEKIGERYNENIARDIRRLCKCENCIISNSETREEDKMVMPEVMTKEINLSKSASCKYKYTKGKNVGKYCEIEKIHKDGYCKKHFKQITNKETQNTNNSISNKGVFHHRFDPNYTFEQFNKDLMSLAPFESYDDMIEWLIPRMSKVIRQIFSDQTYYYKNTDKKMYCKVVGNIQTLDKSLSGRRIYYMRDGERSQFNIWTILKDDPRFTITKVVWNPFHTMIDGTIVGDVTDLDNEFNLFPGMEAKLLTLDEDECWDMANKCKPVLHLLEHIKHIYCRDNINDFQFFTTWLSKVVGELGIKTRVMVILQSDKKQAAYKSKIMNVILCEKIFGKQLAYCVTKGWGPFQNKFNSVLENKLFIWCDELPTGKIEGGTAENVRGCITSNWLDSERKGINVEGNERNYFDMGGASNNKFIAHEPSRIALFKCSDELDGDQDYKLETDKWLDQDIVNLFYTLLYLNKSSLNINDNANFPKNELTAYAELSNKSSVAYWLDELFDHNLQPIPGIQGTKIKDGIDYRYYEVNSFYESYIAFCKKGEGKGRTEFIKTLEFDHGIKQTTIKYQPKSNLTKKVYLVPTSKYSATF